MIGEEVYLYPWDVDAYKIANRLRFKAAEQILIQAELKNITKQTVIESLKEIELTYRCYTHD